MHTQKLSISLPKPQYDFVEQYQEEFHYKTRSEVIRAALYLLQQSHLEACYREANSEIDKDFDVLSSEGIEDDETW